MLPSDQVTADDSAMVPVNSPNSQYSSENSLVSKTGPMAFQLSLL